jgi:hypothetical protein
MHGLMDNNFNYHRLGTFFYPKAMDTVLKLQWERKYMDRLIEKAELTEAEARQALDAAMGDIDYTVLPADAADEEISYWGD